MKTRVDRTLVLLLGQKRRSKGVFVFCTGSGNKKDMEFLFFLKFL